MSDLKPYVDLDTRKLTDGSGAAYTLPTLVMSDIAHVSLRGLRRTTDGVRTVRLNVRSLKASVGPTMTPPTAGGAKLRFGGMGGDPQTANPVAVSATATDMQTALTGVSGDWTPAEVVLADVACWLVRFTQQDEAAPLQVGTVNTLTPRSLVRVRAFQLNGVWWHEVRFLQLPLAFSNGFDEVLPPAPSVIRIQAGGSESALDDIVVNEIQQLTVPRDFRGTYVLKWSGRVSSVLGTEDGPDETAASLNAMWVDGVERFRVTNPEADKGNIEFVGVLGDASQELITTEVKSFEPGSPTFILNLDTAEMGAAMRVAAALERTTLILNTTFELELTYVLEDEDPEDEDIPSRRMTVQLPVKVVREQIYPELETAPSIDWLRHPVARDYIPFDPDQVVTGSQFYSTPLGDGEATEFVVAHGLDSEELIPEIRENVSGGRLLGRTEYHLVFDSENQVTITLAGTPPESNALRLTLLSPLVASALRTHTHSIGQIEGLQAIIDDHEERIGAVEERVPALSRAVLVDGAEAPAEIMIDDVELVLPVRRNSTVKAAEAQKEPAKLGRPLALLKAIHDASVSALTVPLTDPTAEDGTAVYQNQTGDDVDVPGSHGQPSVVLPDDGYLASDGRLWYPVNHGTGTSYFPAAFERELFLVWLASEGWLPGQRFELQFDLQLQMLLATTRCVYTLVIEVGTAPAETSPATTDPKNLSNITWGATPLLTQRLVVTNTLLKHHFGARVKRSVSDVIAADQLKYKAWTTADAAPGGTTFVMRARLIKFDTEDNVTGAKGFIYLKMAEATAGIS